MPGTPRDLPRASRNLAVVAGVIAFHVAALWALQGGLVRRPAELVVPVVPVAMMSEWLPPAPRAAPAPPQPRPPPVEPAAVRKVDRAPPPRPAADTDSAPAPPAAPRSVEPQLPAPAITAPAAAVAEAAAPAAVVAAAPVAPASPPVAPAPAPRLELPSSDADYLQNPKPVYPPLSKRLGEQGTVVLRVLIGADGAAQRAEVRQSSGFDRLDQTALSTVLKWRYVPGRRGGAAETMWFNVPIHFVLE